MGDGGARAMLAAGAVGWGGLVAAGEAVPTWVDYVSRLGVVAFLLLALLGLHRRWWVPGWVYSDLDDRCTKLSQRYDAAIEIALTTSHGVSKTASLLDEALARRAGEPQ